MHEKIEKLALYAGLLNYVDNETPRRCFIDGHADLDEVQKFAELIVRECCQKLENDGMVEIAMELKEHFGVE